MRRTILVLSASLLFPAFVFAGSLTNAFVVASGDGLRFVDGRDFAVTGAVGAADVSLAPNPGWRLLTPPEISVSPGGAVAYRVRSLLGEDEGGGAVTNEVPEAALHLEPPTISASVDADVPYVYTQPQTEMSNIVFRLDGVCDTPGRHGIEGQEPYDHLTPTHWTWEWSFGADTGVVHGASAEVGPFVRTKGAYDFTATLMASNSACPECAVSTNLVRQIVVSELILSGNPWIGQDRTGDPDAQQDYPMFSYSAGLDPANPDVDHIEMDYDGVCDTVVKYGTEIHAWCTNRELSSVSYTNEVFTAVAIPKTNSVPSRLWRRSAGRGGTLRDANGGATPAQANRRGTVQKVDVTIGSWASKEEEESNEESRGSYVLYKGGIPTVADMSFLTPVTFSCSPDNLPLNTPIRITLSDRGTLYMKMAGSDVLTPVTQYPAYVSDLEGKEFYLHGSTVSGNVSDSSIRIEHPESGAVDEARYTVVSFSFDIESENGSPEAADNQLTDNRPGIITIQQRPTSFDLSHANIAFSSVPGATLTIREADGESIINKKGTNISFAPLNPTQWKTSPIYWYGVTPEHECHYYAFDYIFTMFLGGIPVASKQYVVIYPSERPRMTWKTPTDNLSHVTNPVFVQYRDDNGTMQNLWRCEIVFGEYIKEDPSLEGLPVTDQYALETEKEELFHMKQFKGEVPPSEGGLGQCYTKQGIIFYAQRAMGAAFGTPCYIYGATSDDAYERATAILDEAIAFEKAESFRVMAGDFYYREAKAKEYANYNAAWRYHCTFSSECPTPIHCIHEAYLTP